ncbi:MAG: peptidoglycan-binding protein, partial [Lachnospiraceae bacterium]|nr:peptidoglycan-binding protein [Lachnospiraceae bacterium]
LTVRAAAGECPGPDSERNNGNHYWVEESWSEPTCTSPGIASYECVYCGQVRTEQVSGALGHSFGDWVTTQNPTCTANGSKARTCDRCGQTETQAISATGHSWTSWSVTRAATCASEGAQTRTCTVCGASETSSIPATGQHSWSGWSTTKAATCTSEGVKSRTCSVCGRTDTQAIAMVPHSYGSWQRVRESTCTSEGEEAHTCQVCGRRETRSIERKPHNYGEWRVDKEATCTEEGHRTHTCLNCGHEEGQTIGMIPHDFEDWVISVETTDHSSGVRSRVCRRCGLKQEEEFDPEGTVRKGTIGEDAKKVQDLLVDHGFMEAGGADGNYGSGTEEKVRQFQEAHNINPDGIAWPQTIRLLEEAMGDWVVLKKATPFSEGEEERTCSYCDYTQHRTTRPVGILERGDRGDGVKDLQEALNEAGYDCGTADGIFGGKTEEAVKNFQKDENLEEDGIGWPGVLSKLYNIPSVEGEKALILTLTKTEPEKMPYEADDVADFTFIVENTADADIESWELFRASGGEDDWVSVSKAEETAAEKTFELHDQYTVTAEDVASEAAELGWYMVAALTDGKIVFSGAVETALSTKKEPGHLTVTAENFREIDDPEIFGVDDVYTNTWIVTNDGDGDLTDLQIDVEISYPEAGVVATEQLLAPGTVDLKAGETYEMPYSYTITQQDAEEGVRLYFDVKVKAKQEGSGESAEGSLTQNIVARLDHDFAVVSVYKDLGETPPVGTEYPLVIDIVNTGLNPIRLTDMSSAGPGDIMLSDTFDPLPADYILEPFSHITLNYTAVTAYEDLSEGYLGRTIWVHGCPVDAPDEEMLESGRIELKFGGLGMPLPAETAAGPQIDLQIPEIPPYSFDGSPIDIPMTIVNTGEKPLRFVDVKHNSHDSHSTEAWMSDLLEPGVPYEFTYTVEGHTQDDVVNNYEGWLRGYVIAFAEDPETGEETADAEKLVIVAHVSDASLLLWVDDTTGMVGAEGSVLEVGMTGVNNGEVPLKDIVISWKDTDGIACPEDNIVSDSTSWNLMDPGVEIPFTIQIHVRPEDVAKGNAFRQVTIAGTNTETGEIVSCNQMAEVWTTDEVKDLPEGGEDETSGVQADLIVSEIPPFAFDGVTPVEIPMTVINTGDKPLRFVSISHNEEDTVSEEVWMNDYLQPGTPYTLTYMLPSYSLDMVLSWDGWLHRYVELVVRDPETGEYGGDYESLVVVAKIPDPSIMLWPKDTTGTTGSFGEVVPVGLTAVNNGQGRLKDIGFMWEDPAGYDVSGDVFTGMESVTGLEAGESLPVTLHLFVTKDDEKRGSAVRQVTVTGIDELTGETVTDSEMVGIGVIKPSDTAEKGGHITLTALPAPAQALTDGSKVVIELELKNTGTDPVLFDHVQGSAGEGVAEEEWMSSPLGSGESALMTYTAVAGKYTDEIYGMLNRYITAYAEDTETGETLEATALGQVAGKEGK